MVPFWYGDDYHGHEMRYNLYETCKKGVSYKIIDELMQQKDLLTEKVLVRPQMGPLLERVMLEIIARKEKIKEFMWCESEKNQDFRHIIGCKECLFGKHLVRVLRNRNIRREVIRIIVKTKYPNKICPFIRSILYEYSYVDGIIDEETIIADMNRAFTPLFLLNDREINTVIRYEYLFTERHIKVLLSNPSAVNYLLDNYEKFGVLIEECYKYVRFSHFFTKIKNIPEFKEALVQGRLDDVIGNICVDDFWENIISNSAAVFLIEEMFPVLRLNRKYLCLICASKHLWRLVEANLSTILRGPDLEDIVAHINSNPEAITFLKENPQYINLRILAANEYAAEVVIPYLGDPVLHLDDAGHRINDSLNCNAAAINILKANPTLFSPNAELYNRNIFEEENV